MSTNVEEKAGTKRRFGRPGEVAVLEDTRQGTEGVGWVGENCILPSYGGVGRLALIGMIW